MPKFYVDDDHTVHVLEGDADPLIADSSFASVDEFIEIAAHWPLRRLVAIWNKLPGMRAVTRFEDRAVAVVRIWRALTGVAAGQSAAVARKRRGGRRTNKTEVVLRMLRQPEGATLKALMRATKWQAHTVRGFLSAKVSKSLGLEVQSFRRDGERVYAVLPSSQAAESSTIENQ